MKSQKHLFSLTENTHYLNCAYKAPLLKSAEEACMKALIRDRNPSEITADAYFEPSQQVRAAFAKLINASASQIAIIPSVSFGMSSVLNNTKAKQGGSAITIKDEFPSGYFALKKWCDLHGNDLVVVHPDDSALKGESWNKNLLSQINEKTSLVLMSSVHWMNGIKFDLAAIGRKCKAVGAKFIVDGTQSVGAIEMDIQAFQIDALICAGYKWLFGPYSLSLAYFSEDYDSGTPLDETWMNRSNAREFGNLTAYDKHYKSGAARYNIGETSNFILTPILLEGLTQLNQWNPSNIQQYCAELIKPLMDYLHEMNVQTEPEEYFCSHLFSLQLPESINRSILMENLTKNNIFLSVRGPYLRVSINVYNDEADIKKLIEVIERTKEES